METTAGALVVSTSLRSLAASHEVKLGNTLTIANNGPAGSTTFTPSGDSEKIVFTVTIEDPCLTATIPDADLQDSNPASVTSMTLTMGDAGSVTFSAATDSVTTLYSSTIGLCGSVQYELVETNDGSDTAISTAAFTIAGPVSNVYTVHVDTNQDLNLIANEA